VEPLSAKPIDNENSVMCHLLVISGWPIPISCNLFCFLQTRQKYHSRAPLDKVQGKGIDCAEASTSNGEMSALREQLSTVISTPRPSYTNHSASGLGMQMSRHRAAVELAGTNEGEGSPERNKKR
jgi:hypothetical protein